MAGWLCLAYAILRHGLPSGGVALEAFASGKCLYRRMEFVSTRKRLPGISGGMSSRRPFRFRRYWPAGVVLATGLAISAGLGWRLDRQAVELDRLRLQRIAEQVRDRLHSKLQTTDLIMRHAQDYFGSQESFSHGMFREWCRKYGWSITAPWMHGLAFYTNLNTGRWRATVPPDPNQWKAADFKAFRQSADTATVNLGFAYGYSHAADKRWPADYASALAFADGNSSFAVALLDNTPSTTDRRIAVERAGGAAEFGATVIVPVYEMERDQWRDQLVRSRFSSEVRRYNWNLSRGVLLAPVDYGKVESLIWGEGPREVAVEIFAAGQPTFDAWLNPTGQSARALDHGSQSYLTVSLPWKLYNAKWTLFVYTLPAFAEGSPRYMARLTFAAGAVMTLLAAALVGVALQARGRQELLTEQIREARDALASAQKERERLNHDLHDHAIQALYAIQLGLGDTAQKLAGESDRVRGQFTAVRQELDGVIAEIRRFIATEERREQPADLSRVLQAIVERARAGTQAQLELHCEAGAVAQLTDDQAVQLANIAREALSNSLRHGQPKRVRVAVHSDAETLRLEVSDDGCGFDPKKQKRGVGLSSMAKRTEDLRGTMELESAPGKGTRAVIRVPASKATPTAAG